jgi:integrase
MARTIKNAKLDTRSGRTALKMRREPYWTVISAGCAVGYRKGSKGGNWIARMRDDAGRQHYEALGASDDARDADALTVFNFAQAQERARGFFKTKARELAGDYLPEDGTFTVTKALETYFAERERKGSKGIDKDRAAARVRILPHLGEAEVSKLSAKRIRDWQATIAKSPKLVRACKDGTNRNSPKIDEIDADAVRARRASANRTLTVLKAALNMAYHDGRVLTDDAWRKVKPFREADSPVVRYLSDDEVRRLVNSCDGAFRNLVRGALLTGCRYGELCRMRASDYNVDARAVTIRESKAGKVRHVALTDEGAALFKKLTAGKTGKQLIFVRDDNEAWGPSHQQRPLEAASTRAQLEPAATFHILRHTYASMLAMKGVPMGVIAAQIGHADTRMTEKHYAHMSPNYVADTVRAALPTLGIVDVPKVVPIRLVGDKQQ